MASFSDDFTRADADSPGANWTEAAGDTDIVSNALSFEALSYNKNTAIYSATGTAGVDQYLKATFTKTDAAGSYYGFVFRYTNSSSAYYMVQFSVNENEVGWYQYPSIAGSSAQIGSSKTLTVDSGDSYGVTVAGTGSSTVVRIWRNPTANAPTAADTWDGVGPTESFTDDPGASAVDTGTLTGLQNFQANPHVDVDNYFGGDIPSGGRTTKNTRAWPLGINVGMGWRMPA